MAHDGKLHPSAPSQSAMTPLTIKMWEARAEDVETAKRDKRFYKSLSFTVGLILILALTL